MYAVAAWIGAFWACRIAYRAQRGPLRLEPRQRLAWLFIGIGLLCNGLGGAYYIYLEWLGGIDSVPSLSVPVSPFSMVSPLLDCSACPLLQAFSSCPLSQNLSNLRIRLALDALIPTISILGISWYFW